MKHPFNMKAQRALELLRADPNASSEMINLVHLKWTHTVAKMMATKDPTKRHLEETAADNMERAARALCQ